MTQAHNRTPSRATPSPPDQHVWAERTLTGWVGGAGEALARKQRLIGQTGSKETRKPADCALAAGAAAAAGARGRLLKTPRGAARVQARARPLPPATRAALLSARPSQAQVRRLLDCTKTRWSRVPWMPSAQHAEPAAAESQKVASSAAHVRRAAIIGSHIHTLSMLQAQAWLGTPPLGTPRTGAAGTGKQAAAAGAPEPSSGLSGRRAFCSARGHLSQHTSAWHWCGCGVRSGCRGVGRRATTEGCLARHMPLRSLSTLYTRSEQQRQKQIAPAMCFEDVLHTHVICADCDVCATMSCACHRPTLTILVPLSRAHEGYSLRCQPDSEPSARSAAAGLPAKRVHIRFAGMAGEWDTGIRRARMQAGPLAGIWATRAELRGAHGASWEASRVLAVRAAKPPPSPRQYRCSRSTLTKKQRHCLFAALTRQRCPDHRLLAASRRPPGVACLRAPRR